MCQFRDKERFVCTECGGWIEFPKGQLNRAVEDWHLPGSAEAHERDRLAAEINPFMARHRAHGKEPGEVLRLVQCRQLRFWMVAASKQESLGDADLR